jgi:hypothetical protein
VFESSRRLQFSGRGGPIATVGAGPPTLIAALLRTSWWRWAAPVVVVLAVAGTRALWLPAIGRSLVCAQDAAVGDVVILENFDPDYLLFETAADLQRAGLSAPVLVPTPTVAADSPDASPVAQGIVELMTRLAHMRNLEIVPIREIEPYSLNAARQVREHLVRDHVRSILVVAPAFRSRRSSLVYGNVLRPDGIRVHCLAVFGQHTPQNWTTTWHGIQIVTEQFIKLQFYRFALVIR